MTAIKKYFFLFFLLACAGALFLYKAPAKEPVRVDNPVAVPKAYNPEGVFYLEPKNAVQAVASINKNWEKIDILAPQYFYVGADFAVTGAFGPELAKAIKDHNLKVMPLIMNAGFKQAIIHNLLLSPVGQDKVIRHMVESAKANNFIGWQFDFENISYLDKNLFTAFVQKTYAIFQENNLVFSVAVVPRTNDFEETDDFKNWSGVYDYQKIAESSDFVSFMTYDNQKSKGPSSSLDYVNQCLNYVKGKIPAEKLSLGTPLYYWEWNIDTGKKVSYGAYKHVADVMAKYKHVLDFDLAIGVSSLAYSANRNNYKIWFEDKKSFEAKLMVAKANNFKGFSAWQLGWEDPAIWSILDKNY